MRIKVVGMGKFPNSFVCENVEGKTVYLSGGKFLKTNIKIGATYEIETFQAEGRKTVYINKATEITGNVGSPVVNKPKEVASVKEVKKTATPSTVTNVDKMTKADWDKKDKGIKWLTCLKASAEFHARRAEHDVKQVIDDAIKMYYADPESQADGVITGEEDLADVAEGTKDIFADNDL